MHQPFLKLTAGSYLVDLDHPQVAYLRERDLPPLDAWLGLAETAADLATAEEIRRAVEEVGGMVGRSSR